MVVMSESEFTENRECYNGICRKCRSIKDGGVEPDAENYRCEECGENAVMGIENALLTGIIAIE